MGELEPSTGVLRRENQAQAAVGKPASLGTQEIERTLMSNNAPTLLVVLTCEDDPARVTANLTSFLRFSEEVTLGLEDLVERWESTAAPVSRIGRVQGRPPKTTT